MTERLRRWDALTALVVLPLIAVELAAAWQTASVIGAWAAAVGAAIGVLLVLGRAMGVMLARWEMRSAEDAVQRAYAARDFHASLWRVTGSAWIAAALVLIWASRFAPILHFLRLHPYLSFALALAGLELLAVNDYIEWAWRHSDADGDADGPGA